MCWLIPEALNDNDSSSSLPVHAIFHFKDISFTTMTKIGLMASTKRKKPTQSNNE